MQAIHSPADSEDGVCSLQQICDLMRTRSSTEQFGRGGGERTACQVNEPFTPSNIVSRKLAETAKQKDHHSHNITVNRHRESRPLANTHLVQMASQHSLSKAQTTNLQTHTIGARFFQSPARQTTVVRPCWPSLLTFAFFALTACPQHIRAVAVCKRTKV